MEHPKDFAKGLSIGIIMDGNGRWAKSRGLPRTAGHKKGAQVFQDIADYCDELGVESVYFYAFSTENWKRPAEEVGAIMRLFGEYLIKGFDYENRNVRICFMGDRTVLEPKLQELMNKLERDSSCKTGLTINIAINYGGRPEIVRAAQRLAAKAAAGELKPEDITEDALSAQMYTAGQKDPDFILRPSGGKAALQLHALAGGLFGAGGNGRPVARFHPRRPRRRHHGVQPALPPFRRPVRRFTSRCRAACAAPGGRPVFPRALMPLPLPQQGSGSRTKQRRT